MKPTSTHHPSLVQTLEESLSVTSKALTHAVEADPELPTPCPEMDLASMMAHVLAVAGRIEAMLNGHPAGTVADQVTPERSWNQDFAARCDASIALLRRADPDQEVLTPWRAMPITEMVGIYASELVTHSWDLAQATGSAIQISDELAETCIKALDRELPREDRAGFFARIAEQLPPGVEMGMPFAEVPDMPDDATPLEWVVGLSGRDPRAKWQRD